MPWFTRAHYAALSLLCSLAPDLAAFQEQLEDRGDPLAWQYDLGAAPGTIRGLVLNEDGRPFEGVQVATSRRVGDLTDEEGRFLIPALSPGPVVITMQHLGMQQLDSDTIVVPSDAGIWVSAVVTLAGIGGRCGDLVARGDGVRVEITDSATGEIPSVPLTLRLARGDSIWETTQSLRRSRFGGTPLLTLPHRVETAGEYAVEVSAPGYSVWRVEDVWLEPEYAVCSLTAAARHYSVRLVPNR